MQSRLALAVAVVAMVLNGAVLVFGRPVPGWTVAWRGERLAVLAVAPLGRAERLGVVPGDVVVSVDGRPPTQDDADQVTAGRFDEASVMTLDNAVATERTGVLHDYVGTLSMGFLGEQVRTWGRALAAVGLVLLGGGVWAMRAWRPSGPLDELAVPTAAGVATPLFLYSAFEGSEPVAALAAAVGAASVVIALWSLTGSEASRLRAILRACAVLSAVVAVVPRVVAVVGGSVGSAVLAPALLAGTCIVGGVVVALASPRGPAADSVVPLERLFAGGSVGMAWLSVALSGDGGFNPLPLAGWLVGSAIGGLGGLRPLLSRAERSRVERDIFAEAIETQRSMIAADLHDDVLQDLAHLVRRLDQGGDAESARLARGIADRLRDLTYELRLPLLDDLGAGPALEWFADRLERLRGVEIDYEHRVAGRPPADVELAFFRVGQEALTNAVKHGREPIVLRYEATARRARLSVRDAGPGLPADAPSPGGRHLGLVSMRQRAEMIGARLAIGDADRGGTLVTMEWETV